MATFVFFAPDPTLLTLAEYAIHALELVEHSPKTSDILTFGQQYSPQAISAAAR